MRLPAWRLLALTMVLSCGKGSDAGSTTGPPPPASPALTTVSVSMQAQSIIVGGTTTAVAAGTDQFGQPFALGAITWTSASSSIASVSAGGVVTGVAPGTTAVIASVSGKQGQAAITVLSSVSRVVLNPTAITLDAIGATQSLVATPQDAAGAAVTDVPIQWTTSASAVASVSLTGVVTAVGNGSAVITATVLGKTATATVTVAQVATRLALIAGAPSAVTSQPLVPPLRVRVADRLGVAATQFTGTVTATALSGAISGVSSVALTAGEASFDDLRFPNAGTTRLRLSAGGGIAPVDTAVVVLDRPLGAVRATAGSTVFESGSILLLNPLVEAVDSTGKVLNISGVVRASVVRGTGEIVSGDTVTLVAGTARYAALRVRSPGTGVTLGFTSAVLSQGTLDVTVLASQPTLSLRLVTAADSVVARDAFYSLDVVLSPLSLPVGVVRAEVAFDSSRVALVSDSVIATSGTMTRSAVGPTVGSYSFSFLHTTGLTASATLLRLRFQAKSSGGARVDLLLSQLASPLGVSYAPLFTTSSVLVRIP